MLKGCSMRAVNLSWIVSFTSNPQDPYHRHHCFLPFDHRIGSMFLDADEVWEVGGSDESGFSEPLFLAERTCIFLPAKK